MVTRPCLETLLLPHVFCTLYGEVGYIVAVAVIQTCHTVEVKERLCTDTSESHHVTMIFLMGFSSLFAFAPNPVKNPGMMNISYQRSENSEMNNVSIFPSTSRARPCWNLDSLALAYRNFKNVRSPTLNLLNNPLSIASKSPGISLFLSNF